MIQPFQGIAESSFNRPSDSYVKPTHGSDSLIRISSVILVIALGLLLLLLSFHPSVIMARLWNA